MLWATHVNYYVLFFFFGASANLYRQTYNGVTIGCSMTVHSDTNKAYKSENTRCEASKGRT